MLSPTRFPLYDAETQSLPADDESAIPTDDDGSSMEEDDAFGRAIHPALASAAASTEEGPTFEPLAVRKAWRQPETVRRGRFHCPMCGCTRRYTWKKNRPMLGARLFRAEGTDPAVTVGYVECDICRRAWSPDVLTYDPIAQRHERIVATRRFREGLRHAMAAMAIVDGVVREEEVSELCVVNHKLTGESYDPDGLTGLFQSIRRRFDNVLENVAEAATDLPQPRRIQILHAVLRVAVADLEFTDTERYLARQIGEALSLPPRVVRSAMIQASMRRKALQSAGE